MQRPLLYQSNQNRTNQIKNRTECVGSSGHYTYTKEFRTVVYEEDEDLKNIQIPHGPEIKCVTKAEQI